MSASVSVVPVASGWPRGRAVAAGPCAAVGAEVWPGAWGTWAPPGLGLRRPRARPPSSSPWTFFWGQRRGRGGSAFFFPWGRVGAGIRGQLCFLCLGSEHRVLSPGLRDSLAGVPRLPGQCWRSERLAIHGVQRPRPRACGGPCWPWPWPWPSDWGTPVCLCLRRPLLTRPVEPLGDSGATPSFPHCPSPGPRLPRGGRDLSS